MQESDVVDLLQRPRQENLTGFHAVDNLGRVQGRAACSGRILA